MKRLIILMVSVFANMYCFAGGLKVKEGSAAFLKEKVNAVVEFDFSTTTWEKDEDFKTWCGNQYEKRLQVMKESFIESFNINSKGLKIDNSKDANYKIVIEVKDLERHQAFTGAIGQGKISTTGTIIVYDKTSNQKVCVIDVKGYGSGKDFDHTDGMGKCYKGLAKEFLKLK